MDEEAGLRNQECGKNQSLNLDSKFCLLANPGSQYAGHLLEDITLIRIT